MFKHMNKVRLTLGVDIGGSHICAALARVDDGQWLPDSYSTKWIDPTGEGGRIIDDWMEVIHRAIACANGDVLTGIGVAMPGPFDYENGISLIEGVSKYEKLFGINIKQAFLDRLEGIAIFFEKDAICFENDAACFGLGECVTGKAAGYKKVIAITLGTGFGAAFVDGGQLVKGGAGVPADGFLYNIPFLSGIAEDYISSRWLLSAFEERSGIAAKDVREIAARALSEDGAAGRGVDAARETFRLFGERLGIFLSDRIKDYGADCLVIGGSIAQSEALFLPAMLEVFAAEGVDAAVEISQRPEIAAMTGAARLVGHRVRDAGSTCMPDAGTSPPCPPCPPRRMTNQALLPKRAPLMEPSRYNIYPFETLGGGHIFSGYAGLARWISHRETILIDGYIGIDWAGLRSRLSQEFRRLGVKVLWYETSAFMKPAEEIEVMVAPFLGSGDSVWGTRTTLTLSDFFRQELGDLAPAMGEGHCGAGGCCNIVLGIGAGLCGLDAPVLYVELPKNEIQYRMRAGSAGNLGRAGNLDSAATGTQSQPEMYKRSYFVDWVVLNRHRQQIKTRIAVVADGQWGDDVNWALASSVRQGLDKMAHNLIRARPWFEPGVWGGQWMKQHIPGLNPAEINYAWSFELIAPENGIVLEGDGNLLEIAFDWLMEHDAGAVLGKDADRFGTEFPIRFDFLDTFSGGNLSIQCHPSLDYIREQFGESITQDETYYILDCTPDAGVYLGFCEDIDPATFRAELEQSQASNEAIDIQQYVQRLPSEKHGLYLIPNCTVHGAGKNNLVLEISATPYIFTFKMYDWMRLDLNGRPRPINIEHAFNNLDFARRGKKVREELVSKPIRLPACGDAEPACGDAEPPCGDIEPPCGDTQVELLPTHPEHFYAIHRVSFLERAVLRTEGKCLLLMLVEGTSLTVKTKRGAEYLIHFAETFVLPAAAEECELINHHHQPVKLIKAFVK
jgi:predicted NBD/HSP70 family sugar kinase/mannose-6-phosphate isomerase class I